jgi:hypothetical protein
MMACPVTVTWSARPVDKDAVPEWSDGVDQSYTSANCAGSNLTGVI